MRVVVRKYSQFHKTVWRTHQNKVILVVLPEALTEPGVSQPSPMP